MTYAVVPEMQMPLAVQTMLLTGGGVLFVACLIYGVLQSRKYHSLLPALFPLSGFAAIVLEAPVCSLGHIVHAQIGQVVLYEAVGLLIPWHMAFLYGAYYGFIYLLIYGRFVEHRLSSQFLWTLYLGSMVFSFAGFIIPTQQGAWAYMEPQALWVWHGTQPLFWTFSDAGSGIVSATLIMHLLPRLTGWKQFAIVAIAPLACFMGHFGLGYPFYISGNTHWGNLAIQASGVLVAIFSLLSVKICAEHLIEKQALVNTSTL
jgi:hypothetical protein